MSGYIGSKASVVSSGAERKKVFTITTTTTSLTGLAYTPTKVHVFHNGIRLVDGTDYTATNGTSITLTNAAENGDEVVVVSYASFQVADAYTQAESDVRYVQVAGDTLTGALTGTDLTLSGGVYLGGTGSANKLDDYEEGTWTPVITGGVSGSSSGWYRKVGSIVYLAANIYRPTDISSSTDVSISGLPFAGDTTVGFTQNVGIAIRYANVSGKQLAGFGVGSGTTSGAIRIFTETSGDYDGLQHSAFTSSYSAIQINGTYMTNS